MKRDIIKCNTLYTDKVTVSKNRGNNEGHPEFCVVSYWNMSNRKALFEKTLYAARRKTAQSLQGSVKCHLLSKMKDEQIGTVEFAFKALHLQLLTNETQKNAGCTKVNYCTTWLKQGYRYTVSKHSNEPMWSTVCSACFTFSRLLKFSKRRRILWHIAFGSPSRFMACKSCSLRISVSVLERFVELCVKNVKEIERDQIRMGFQTAFKNQLVFVATVMAAEMF